MSLSTSVGFFMDAVSASRELKCTPLLLSSRKFSNFLLVAAEGDPGGEGGMSMSGTAGNVRSRSSARVAVYGDPGGSGTSTAARSSSNGGKLSPDEGPICGP